MDNETSGDLPAIPNQDAIEARILEEVFVASLEETPALVALHLQELAPDLRGSQLELFLQSLWNHFEGIRVVKEEGKFKIAKNLQESAAAGFKRLQVVEMESSARALSSYATAIIELQQLNINRSQQLFKETEDYLRSAGRFGKKFQPFIDHIKPEALFISALSPLMAGDMDSARILINQASSMSEKVANTYHADNPVLSSTFHGLAHFYEAFFDFSQAQRDLNKLELDKLESEDICKNAVEAEP